MTTSENVPRPLSNCTVVIIRKDVLLGIVALACAGPSAVAIADWSLDNAGRWLRNSFSADGVMPGNAAITSDGAIRTSTSEDPLHTVTNGKTRSTSTGGRPRTRLSSFTWVKSD